jgi:hypothetical protein
MDISHFFNSSPVIGSFDGTVHLSEEASNAATAVPWAIVGSIVVSAILGMGQSCSALRSKWIDFLFSRQSILGVLHG